MKIWYGSDMHTEWWPFGMTILDLIPNYEEFDLFIIAGDIAEWRVGGGETNNAMKDVIRPLLNAGKRGIVIPGNHEFYDGDYDEINEDMYNFFSKIDGFEFLQFGDLHQIKGVVDIIGGTLWTDVFNGNFLAGKFMQSRMNDRANITRGFRRLSYKDFMSENAIMLKSIDDLFKSGRLQGNGVPVIVVSHHAPSFKSLHPDFINGDPDSLDNRTRYINSGYASNLDAFIKSHAIDYWIHGHVHHVFDYMLGNTRILCNPFGYIGVTFESVNKNLKEGVICLK